ncbi:MAG TPA: HAMP domain-containing sensor histidine kinase [Vitreimonas sp.]|uniref:sensor histidine kinase n=1 Tax=Vitreimonas sp. TaxID=3069702 RepID=UPI002D529828|nr:HAMP domain-containing sensor histidine kinase [Vitreimonas sp.]HYD89199.1 HAMP domain-containing sensor histidine kinase [Vitreimonas sp.]
MRPSLALLRTTTFRLALAQAGVVLLFVVALLVYVYFATIGQLVADSDILADQEYAALERAYAEGGIRRLNQEVVERSASQGPLLYVLAEANGAVITGDFPQLPALPGEAVQRVDFSFETTNSEGSPQRSRARGQVGRLLNGPILLVARDLGDSAVITGRITRVLWTVAILGVILSVASGLTASWFASRRVEALANTARDVMGGDLKRRAPVRGEGDEFDELAEAINAMLDRLERLMIVSRTAGDAIAHDLRSPLTRFRQKLEAALEAPEDSRNDREALRKALEEADNLLDMFAAVLKLARVESNPNWRFERIDASEVLQELVEFYEPAAEEQGRTLRGEVAPGLVVNGEPGLFTQAVSNLVENALKYTPEGGHIDLSAVRRADGRIEIAVLDDGPGIPPADRDRVLERFVRLESARSSPGAGLGLSLVAAVARLHKGGLHLRDGLSNGEGKGLGAALVLPAAA